MSFELATTAFLHILWCTFVYGQDWKKRDGRTDWMDSRWQLSQKENSCKLLQTFTREFLHSQ